MGSCRATTPKSPMLMIMATTVRAVGTGLVKPSVYFRPMAQATSKSPATTSNIHASEELIAIAKALRAKAYRMRYTGGQDARPAFREAGQRSEMGLGEPSR